MQVFLYLVLLRGYHGSKWSVLTPRVARGFVPIAHSANGYVAEVGLQSVNHHPNVSRYTWNKREQKMDKNKEIGLLPTNDGSWEF